MFSWLNTGYIKLLIQVLICCVIGSCFHSSRLINMIGVVQKITRTRMEVMVFELEIKKRKIF